jgi:hypothetical protein
VFAEDGLPDEEPGPPPFPEPLGAGAPPLFEVFAELFSFVCEGFLVPVTLGTAGVYTGPTDSSA